MYQALYRKWRPTIFEDVLGQEHITSTIKNQIINQKLSHAYLFSGTRGTGKTSTAKILSRAVNCMSLVNGNPCNKCHACITSLNGSTVDIVEIDAASNNKVEDARMIREEVIYTPAELKYKVYIIDEAHMLTNSAFNALLKTLEEPPPHIIFIFATTEPHKFPPTILSRCQRFDFKRITPYDTEKRIKQIIANDNYTISDDAISLLCRIADGSMRDALSILDQCLSSGKADIDFSDIAEITGSSDPNFIYSFAQKLIDCDLSSAFLFIKEAYEKGRDIERILEDLTSHFRNVLISKTLNDKNTALDILMVTDKAYEIYKLQSDMLSVERILRYIDILQSALETQKYSSNPRLAAEIAITGIVKRPDISDSSGILERLMELENKVKNLNNGVVRKPVKEPSYYTINNEVPKTEEKNEIETEVFNDFVPDFQVETKVIDEIEPVETKSVVTESVETVEKLCEVEEAWEDIFIVAKKNAGFGFDKIIKSAKIDFSDDAVELLLENEAYLNISKMNKFDDVLKKAINSICDREYSVRIISGKKEEKNIGNNYDYLMNKLESYSENISFFD